MSRQPDIGDASVAPAAPESDPDRFAWHPRYRGRTLSEVQAELTQEIARDQRAYALVMEGAESEENATLAAVLDLERKWGPFDLNWAESDPAALAARIVAFEQERDRRRELLPYTTYRDAVATPRDASAGSRRSATAPSTSFAPSSRLRWLALAVVAAVILLILIVLVT